MMNEVQKSKIEKLNQIHTEIVGSIQMTLKKAIEAGGILREMKKSLPHGSFTLWVEDNIMFDIRTAQRYMRAYKNRDRLKNDSVSYLKDLIEEPMKKDVEQDILDALHKESEIMEAQDLQTDILLKTYYSEPHDKDDAAYMIRLIIANMRTKNIYVVKFLGFICAYELEHGNIPPLSNRRETILGCEEFLRETAKSKSWEIEYNEAKAWAIDRDSKKQEHKLREKDGILTES
jgi:hypothetical protein